MKESIHNLLVMLSGFGSQKMEDLGFTTGTQWRRRKIYLEFSDGDGIQ